MVTVDSTNLRFSPSTVTITEGDSVRFFWSGELLAHNAVADDGLFDSGEPSREVDYSFTFEIGTNGTHTYVCEPHEAMGNRNPGMTLARVRRTIGSRSSGWN